MNELDVTGTPWTETHQSDDTDPWSRTFIASSGDGQLCELRINVVQKQASLVVKRQATVVHRCYFERVDVVSVDSDGLVSVSHSSSSVRGTLIFRLLPEVSLDVSYVEL